MTISQLIFGLIVTAVGAMGIYYALADKVPPIVFALLTPPWVTGEKAKRSLMSAYGLLYLVIGIFLVVSALLGRAFLR
jgi:hypothetical protein